MKTYIGLQVEQVSYWPIIYKKYLFCEPLKRYNPCGIRMGGREYWQSQYFGYNIIGTACTNTQSEMNNIHDFVSPALCSC